MAYSPQLEQAIRDYDKLNAQAMAAASDAKKAENELRALFVEEALAAGFYAMADTTCLVGGEFDPPKDTPLLLKMQDADGVLAWALGTYVGGGVYSTGASGNPIEWVLPPLLQV